MHYSEIITESRRGVSSGRSKSPECATFEAVSFPGSEPILRGANTSRSALGDTLFHATSLHTKRIAIIETRPLVRDCLVRTIQANGEIDVVGIASVEDALVESAASGAALLVLSLPGPLIIAQHGQDITRLISETGLRVAVLGDGGNLAEIAGMFEKGAVGYISTTLSAEVVVQSLKVMLAGGKFIPASLLLTARPADRLRTPPLDQYKCMFTERQIAVLRALCAGKANKVIANELQMKEGTVKVHVRNLMKQLKAQNRTELALIVARAQAE